MADTVQYHLERMLPELEDLEKQELFSQPEIKEIVRRRRDFEYLLKRRSAIKDDYLRYIEYEKNLEALRQLRKKAKVKGGQVTDKRLLAHSDHTSPMRIMLIYQRAVTKWKGDLALWLQYMEYCKVQGSRRMRKVVASALKLHPAVPGLWMYAAAWEFERNLNVSAARSLMLRGLRMCPASEELWLEYFRMELAYVKKLIGRKYILGLKSSSQDVDQSLGKDMPVEPEIELGIKLAKVVFRNAIEAIPSSPGFRIQFLEALNSHDIAQSDELQEEIWISMLKDFPTNEDCWDWKARSQMREMKLTEDYQKREFTNRYERAVKIYEQALCAIQSPRMYELYAQFLEDHLDSTLRVSEKHIKSIANSLLKVYEHGETAFTSSNLAEKHIHLLMRWGRLEEARNLCKSFCNGTFRKSAKIWCLRISIEIKANAVGNDKSGVICLFEQALQLVSFAEAKALWYMVMEFFSGSEGCFAKFQKLLSTYLRRGFGGAIESELACCIIDWVLHNKGLEEARQTYDNFLLYPGASLQLFKHCITLEARSAAAGDFKALPKVRNIYDLAIRVYGRTETLLWQEYLAFELKNGDAEASGAIYWRARKTLEDPSSFIENCQFLPS